MAKRDNAITAWRVAHKCSDAYSTFAYASWPTVAEKLLDRGLTEQEAEAVMRAKWTRWAGDSYAGKTTTKYGRYPAKAIIDFLNKMQNERQEIENLTRETFSSSEIG